MNHRIRLGPPWQIAETNGVTRHVRNFGRPRSLAPAERVWLVCEAVPAVAVVTVNGQPLGTAEPGSPFAVDVTDLLNDRNQLAFEVPSSEPIGAVRLEIRPTIPPPPQPPIAPV